MMCATDHKQADSVLQLLSLEFDSSAVGPNLKHGRELMALVLDIFTLEQAITLDM